MDVMDVMDDLLERQKKNVRNKIRDIINKCGAEVLIMVALLLKVYVPPDLLKKYEKNIKSGT